MSSLYIGGAQCVHADFSDSEDWDNYDQQQQEMTELALKFNVAISRYCLDEGDYSFVIMNKKADHKCFYEGAAFETDMSIEVSDAFESRAHEFINALNQEEKFKTFHNLNWSKPKVLYFCTS